MLPSELGFESLVICLADAQYCGAVPNIGNLKLSLPKRSNAR